MKIWQTKKLGEVCDILIGGTPRRGVFEYWKNGTLPWVSIRDMSQEGDVINNTKEKITEKGAKESNVKLLPKGTLLLSFKLSIGKLAFAGQDLYTNEAIAGLVIKSKEELDKGFLYYFLKQTVFDTAHKAVKGNTLNKEKMKVIAIPVIPLSVQKGIVNILDKKIGKIAEAKRLRTDALADTEKILSQTLAEIFEKGKEKGWKEKTIGDIADQIKSGFACGKQNEVSDGVVHLRTHNISLDGKLNLDKIIRIPKKFVNTEVFSLKKGDIIFNNTNSVELVGKTILVEEDLPYAFSNHLTRIRFDKKIVSSSWVLYIFQKFWSDKIFERLCTRWIGQAGINQTSLSKLKILLPPLSEQSKIVAKLNVLSARIRELKELQTSQLEDLKSLERAYLREAFNGELIK